MNFLNKKRLGDSKIDYTDDCEKEKYKFIAKIKKVKKNSRNNTIIIKVEKISGKNLVFKHRKEKAMEII